MREERDIGDEDGTGEHANAKNRESLDLDVETASNSERRLREQEGGNEARHRETTHTRATTHRGAAVNGENGEDEGGGHQGEDGRGGRRRTSSREPQVPSSPP